MHDSPSLRAEGFDPKELIAFANELGDAARPIARAHFRRPLVVEQKADASPVTVADRDIESELRAMITARFPEHGIIGEEHGSHQANRRCLWVIDPIDGTKAFVTGLPTFGTLVAFVLDDRALLGLVEMPALGERWVGAQGFPTLMGERVCRTSGRERLVEASLFASSPYMFNAVERPRFEAVSRAASITRFGADCYAYGLLASGFTDLVVEADMKPYDYLALVAVVESAGGTITDWRGDPLGLSSDGRIVAAATAALHQQALELLSE